VRDNQHEAGTMIAAGNIDKGCSEGNTISWLSAAAADIHLLPIHHQNPPPFEHTPGVPAAPTLCLAH
jgi:hypothetical protein